MHNATLVPIALLLAAPALAQPEFIPLGLFPSDFPESQAHNVSADGSVVVGQAMDGFDDVAFRWTMDTGLVSLGDLPGGTVFSRAWGVNADGSVVVGDSRGGDAGDLEAFRWTEAGGMVGLGHLADGYFMPSSSAEAVSDDGSVVVGYSTIHESPYGARAFLWTEAGGMVNLGELAGGDPYSWAHAVSGDGTVVVGESGSELGQEAFRWTEAEGMMGLGDLPTGPFWSKAIAVSAGGSVVFGKSLIEQAGEDVGAPFRWTQAEGMVQLFDVPDGHTVDLGDAAPDGSVVVGGEFALDYSEFIAWMWNEQDGLVDLKQLLLDAGVDDVAGWTLRQATGVSSDGLTIVGTGTNPQGVVEAYLIRLASACPADVNGDGNLNILDFVAFQLLWQAADPAADCDANAEFNVLDFVCFQQLFAQGCG